MKRVPTTTSSHSLSSHASEVPDDAEVIAPPTIKKIVDYQRLLKRDVVTDLKRAPRLGT